MQHTRWCRAPYSVRRHALVRSSSAPSTKHRWSLMTSRACVLTWLQLRIQSQTLCLVRVRSIQFRNSDVPLYSGFVSEAYPGSGHSVYFPATRDEWDSLLGKLEVSFGCGCCMVWWPLDAGACGRQANNFIDMHTRIVILEVALYNPGLNLVGTARCGVEFLASGAVLPTCVHIAVRCARVVHSHFLVASTASACAPTPCSLVRGKTTSSCGWSSSRAWRCGCGTF